MAERAYATSIPSVRPSVCLSAFSKLFFSEISRRNKLVF